MKIGIILLMFVLPFISQASGTGILLLAKTQSSETIMLYGLILLMLLTLFALDKGFIYLKKIIKNKRQQHAQPE